MEEEELRQAGVRLNVGCGPEVYPGWINLDKSPSVLLARFPRLRRLLLAVRLITPEQAVGFPRGAVHVDVTRRLPFSSGSVDLIYSAHMIEHLSPSGAERFFEECYRVLRPEGLLRLATPDLAQLIDDYREGSSPFLSEEPTRADAFCAEYNAYRDRPGEAVKRFVRKYFGADSHQWLYDFESLSLRLKLAGMRDIARRDYRAGEMPDLSSIERRERSLFVEARK